MIFSYGEKINFWGGLDKGNFIKMIFCNFYSKFIKLDNGGEDNRFYGTIFYKALSILFSQNFQNIKFLIKLWIKIIKKEL